MQVGHVFVLAFFSAHGAGAGVWDTSRAIMPSLRSEVGTVMLNGVVYVCGGFDLAAFPTNVCESYDVGADSWDASMADLPAAWDHGKLTAVNGRLYFIGGGIVISGVFTDTDIEATIELPDTWNLSGYHEIDDKLAVVASVHYTNWSTLDRIDVKFDNPLQPPTALVLEWDDTWRVSAGAIYKLNDDVTLRGGLAWDESPIPDKTRTPRIPGNDRYWISVGVGYRVDEDVSIDIGIAHLFIKDADVDQLSAEGNRLEGDFSADTNILSVQFTVGF